jgi:hypothetical protein
VKEKAIKKMPFDAQQCRRSRRQPFERLQPKRNARALNGGGNLFAKAAACAPHRWQVFAHPTQQVKALR